VGEAPAWQLNLLGGTLIVDGILEENSFWMEFWRKLIVDGILEDWTQRVCDDAGWMVPRLEEVAWAPVRYVWVFPYS